MFNFDKYMGSGIMVFDKDTKIRGDDLDESYTLYNIENGAHLFYSLRLDDYESLSREVFGNAHFYFDEHETWRS